MMQQIEREEFLQREFGLCYEFDEWFYTGICVINHDYTELSSALTQVMMITTWREYSKNLHRRIRR